MGKFSTKTGAISGQTCTFCRAGSYAEAQGSTTCTLCESGKYSEAVAATAASGCKEVVIAVNTVVPTMGGSTGGQSVRVEMHVFNLAGTVRDVELQFAGVKLGGSDLRVSTLSDKFYTFLYFTTPSTAPGEVDVTVSETPCSNPCRQVSFKFKQLDESAMRLISHFPKLGAMQRTDMTMKVLISNFPSGSTVTVDFGIVASSISEIKVVDEETTFLTVLVPAATSTGAVGVNITANPAGSGKTGKTVSFEYTYFDGNTIRPVMMEPSVVPVSTVVSEKFISLRPTVSVIIANLPQSTQNTSQQLGGAMYGIKASCGGAEALIKSMHETSVCKTGEFDCDRTKIVFELPAFQTPISREIKILIPGQMEISAGTVIYGSGCNYDTACPSTKIADLLGVAGASSSMSCDQTLCLDKITIPEPEILSVSISTGSSLGGESVLLHFKNLPILDASDMKIEFQTSATSKVNAQISSVSLKPGSSFMGSQGWCDFKTPSVDPSTEKVTVTLSVSLGVLRQAASFEFDFFNPITGPAVLEDIQPKMLKKNDDVRIKVQLSNFPIIQRPHNLSLITVQIGAKIYPGAVKAIIESNRQLTVFAVSVEKPEDGWTGDSLAVKFYSYDINHAASFSLQISSTPAPTIFQQFPSKGRSNVGTQVSISIGFLEIGTTPILVSGGATLSQATAKHDTTCAHRDCSLYDLKITVPTLLFSPTGMTDASFVITSGNFSTNFNFTYIPAEAPELKIAHPKVQTLGLQAGVKEIKVLLDKFPSSACGQAAKSCVTEAAGTVVMFGNVQGTVMDMSNVANGALELTLLAPLAIMQAQAVTVEIKSLGSGTVSFDYAYASYATIQPVDGPVEGGVMVTISAVGLHSSDAVVERTQLQIRFGEAAVDTSNIESVQHVDDGIGLPMLKVVLRTLTAAKAGEVKCTICLMPQCNTAHAVSTFVFTYFSQPSVLKITPSKVTLEGRTNVATGSSLVELTILDFPKLDKIDQLELTIANAQCNGTICHIDGFSQSAISTKVWVHVPALTSVGLKTVRLVFQDAAGGMPRIAESMLEYYSPQPVILSAHWCEECNDGNMCIRNGLCKNGAALKGTAKLSGKNLRAILERYCVCVQ